MKKFLALSLGTPNDEKFKAYMAMSEEDQKKTFAAGMAAWEKWQETYKEHIVDLGGPLGKTKHVDVGGISDAHNNLSGYTIVTAENIEEATKMFENHPHFTVFPGTGIEVMPVLDQPSDDQKSI